MSSVSVPIGVPIAKTTLTDDDFAYTKLSLSKKRKAFCALICIPIIGHIVGYTDYNILGKSIKKMDKLIDNEFKLVDELRGDPKNNDKLDEVRRKALNLIDFTRNESYKLRCTHKALLVSNVITSIAYAIIAFVGTALVGAPILFSAASLSFCALAVYANHDIEERDRDSNFYRQYLEILKENGPTFCEEPPATEGR